MSNESSKSEKRKFTYGKEFSPDTFRLDRVISHIIEADGSAKKLQAILRVTYWEGGSRSAQNANTMALNTFLTLRSYGLIDRGPTSATFTSTPLLETLSKIPGAKSEEKRRRVFGRHILLNLDGLVLIGVIAMLKSDKEQVTLESIGVRLNNYGVEISGSSGYVSTMRQWLADVGVFSAEDDYEVVIENVEKLIGVTADDVRQVSTLTNAQAAFVVDPNSTGHFFYARRSALWNFKSMRQVSGSSLPSLS